MSEAISLEGTVKVIFDEQTFASGFNKREFVITNKDDQYPQDIKFECTKDKVKTVADKLTVGDEVSVAYNIRGNEYNGKYYVNLVAWGVKILSSSKVAQSEDIGAKDEVLDEEPPF